MPVLEQKPTLVAAAEKWYKEVGRREDSDQFRATTIFLDGFVRGLATLPVTEDGSSIDLTELKAILKECRVYTEFRGNGGRFQDLPTP